MTPAPPGAARQHTIVGLLAGIFTGLTLCGGVVGGLGFGWAMKAKADSRRGWNLVPVVVAAEARPAGAAMMREDLTQRAMPDQIVTSSTVKPDSARYVLGQPLTVPVAKGEPLLWSNFSLGHPVDALTDQALLSACHAQLLAHDGPPAVTTVESARAAVVRRQGP